MYEKSIYIFTRDLRLNDNTALIEALKSSKIVIPIFIFNPKQIKNNSYKSNNCIQFMLESLESLDKQLKKHDSRLYFFYDNPSDIINKLIKKHDINAIYMTIDYTPFAKKRSELLLKICNENNISYHEYEDISLTELIGNKNKLLNKTNNIYVKFTPFLKNAKKIKVRPIQKNNYTNYINKKIKLNYEFNKDIFSLLETKNNMLHTTGGREHALNYLKNIKNQKDYNKNRNILSYNTSYLSAYNKFGCISIREIYYKIKKYLTPINTLFTQLYWRDFYYNIVLNFPNVIGHSMKEKYNKIKWNKNNKLFKKWCNGETGYPIIDACMRQLNTTGFMHNRGRLIVSSFLIKILGIDWQKGEKYFATQLVDYDISQNNGNWQWASGSGTDSQPYFRIFNPWLQSEKYDNNCEYIKKWVPELSNVENKDIHKWYESYKKYQEIKYPKPIVNYDEQKIKILEIYKKALY